MKKKIAVVVTARPSYSRVKTAITAIKEHPELELQLVLAASALLDRYGRASDVIEADGFDIAARIYNVLEGEDLRSMAKTTGLGIMELSAAFDQLTPDAVVTIADRFETMSTAIAAAYMNIPLIHIQGGEVTGNIDEKVRHAITKLSDLHLVSNDHAKARVIKMGEEPSTVITTGCPSIDLAKDILDQKELPFDPYKKYGGVGECPDLSNGYVVVLQHPVTTEYELSKIQIETTLDAIQAQNMPTLWFWPNVDAGADGTSKGIRSYREKHKVPNIHFFKNMAPQDFLRLLKASNCIIGNSSVAIRECSFLGVPAINIGTRQNGRDRGSNVIDVDHSERQIKQALESHMNSENPKSDELYGSGNAGVQIANAIASSQITINKRLTY